MGSLRLHQKLSLKGNSERRPCIVIFPLDFGNVQPIDYPLNLS